MQSDKNSRNSIYIKKEFVHNLTSLTFCILGLVLLLLTLMYSIIHQDTILIVYSSIFASFMFIRLIITIVLMIGFDRLVNRISPEHIEIYITKQWTRKREGAIWVGIMYIVTLILFLMIAGIVSNFIDGAPILLTSIIIAIHIFIIVIYMFTNIQSIDSRLRISEKRISLESMEWVQIRKDQANYYKLLMVWYFHFLFILPLILMIIPFYRHFWQNLLKN